MQLIRRTRREFLDQGMRLAAGAALAGALVPAGVAVPGSVAGPDLQFPKRPRDRIAVASYPFRDFIIGRRETDASLRKMPIKDFGAHVAEKFGVKLIEPWSSHFLSLDADYLADLRATLAKAGVGVANIAVDGEQSVYSPDPEERQRAIAFSKSWIDAAAAIQAPSVRTNIARAKATEADVERTAESLRLVAEYAASKNVIVNLENDNPVSEDPYFLVRVIEHAGTPWLRALPDFGNTLASHPADYAYDGITKLFAHAYNICHVKAMEENRKGDLVHVDLERAFGILRASSYRGYCSMEFDSPGDPYAGTRELIEKTLKGLEGAA